MELKGINTLTTFLDNWLSQHGFSAITTRIEPDFAYYRDSETIAYALCVPDETDVQFLTFLQDVLGLEYEVDPFLASFFHELGHAETLDFFNNEDLIDYEFEKMLINMLELPSFKYYSLDIERAASAWAVDFIHDNPALIQEFWQQCQPLILNIYKLNNVETEEI